MSSKYTGTVVQLSFDIDTGGFSAIDTGGFSAQQLARHRGISTASWLHEHFVANVPFLQFPPSLGKRHLLRNQC